MSDSDISPQDFLNLYPCKTCMRKFVDGDHIGQDIAPARGNVEQHLFEPNVPTLKDIFGG